MSSQWLKSLYQPIEMWISLLAKGLAWLTFLLVIIEFSVVALRYLFDFPSISLQESALWVFSFIFMLGTACTLGFDEHVRVDIFYRKCSIQFQTWVNLFGIIFLLFPVCFYLIYFSWHTVQTSWVLNEASSEAGGLPALYLLKSLMIVMPILLSIQGLAWMLRCIDTLLQKSIVKIEHQGMIL